MALELTDNLKQELLGAKVTPILVLKIEGYATIFNNTLIKEYIRIGDAGLRIGEPFAPESVVWQIGGFKYTPDQSPFINFNIGTTTKISQKLDPSRGQGTSVSQMSITLVDKSDEITEFISPGFILEEILGRRVTVYLGVESSSFPEDYNVVFRGNIQDVEAGSGSITLNLNNTEERKRQVVLSSTKAETTERINYRSVNFQDLFYKARSDFPGTITVEYVGIISGTDIVVTVAGTTISVQINPAVHTAPEIKKAIENDPDANQMVEVVVEGDDSALQAFGDETLVISTSVLVDNAVEFFEPADAGTLRTYLKVSDELVEYTGITVNQFTGLVRGSENTLPEIHNSGTSVSEIIRLAGNGIDLILKLLLSNGPEFFGSTVIAKSINYIDVDTSIDNAIFFENINLEVEYGISKLDFVTIEDSAIPGNNVIDSIVLEVGLINGGTYLILSDTLTTESTTNAKAYFKSRFNTLPFGVGLLPYEVDVKQHLFVRDTFLSSANLDLITDTIPNGKDFIEKEFYLTLGCYSVPRKGRSSIVYQAPPLPNYEIITLDKDSVINPDALKVRRSISENFFNEVTFAYDYDIIQNEFSKAVVYESAGSKSRIGVGSKAFEIESKALRTSSGALDITSQAANRYLRRYQFGAEFIKGIKVLYGRGYQIEIGDIVNVDYGSLKLSDFDSGTRSGGSKLMEVLNKTLDNKTGEIMIDVVNTIFGVSDRLGLISPSSLTGVGSTASKLILQKSFSTQSYERESTKWTSGGYVGQMITVRNEDFTTSYDTIIRGFDNNDPQGMLVDPLPVSVGQNFIISNPRYPNSTDTTELEFWKARHAYFSPQVHVINAAPISQADFEVDPADIGKFFIGSEVLIHSEDYSDESVETVVTAIDTALNIVTIETPTGFGIDDTHYVDLIGFPDHGSAYRII